MIKQGYRSTTSNHYVFVKRFTNREFIILFLYVDDMLIIGQVSDKIKKLKIELSTSFVMKDLGLAKRILGMNIYRDKWEVVVVTGKVHREGIKVVQHG